MKRGGKDSGERGLGGQGTQGTGDRGQGVEGLRGERGVGRVCLKLPMGGGMCLNKKHISKEIIAIDTKYALLLAPEN